MPNTIISEPSHGMMDYTEYQIIPDCIQFGRAISPVLSGRP
jgi:hypothetical protein